MGSKHFKFYGLFVSMLLTISACTGSGDEQPSNVEVLSSQRVFTDDSVLASFDNSADVVSFDDSNRPLMANETINCPVITPPPTGGETPPDDGGGVTPPPAPPTCNAGFEYNGEACVSICKDNQIYAQDKCYDKEISCDVANGSGSQEWMANMYGACKPNQCDDGYEVQGDDCAALCKEGEVYNNGKCLPNIAECKEAGLIGVKIWEDNAYGKCHVSHDCKMENGKGMERYNKQTLQYERCEVTTCDSGYKASDDKQACVNTCKTNEFFNGKKCLPQVTACNVAGGLGEKSWNAKTNKYGWCQVTSCNRGFIRTGNACRRPSNDDDDSADPLLVDLGADFNNAKGISLSSQLEGILFDILGLNSTPSANTKKQISWTNQQRYQWVVKPDANGQVLGIDQMFGDNTLGPDGQFAAEGFSALAKYDLDKNGVIDTEDPIYNKLALWHDANGNGVSDAGELTPFSSAFIDSIDLKYDPNFFEVDIYGNKTTYKSVVRFSDGRKTLIFDMWFKFLDPVTANPGGGTEDPGAGGGGSTPGDGGTTPPNQCPVAQVVNN